MSQGEKICVHCGKSCAGQARVKDSSGNYAHAACAEQRSGASSKARRSSAPSGEAGSMAAILSDLDEKDLIGGEHSCQGCGYPMEDQAVVCLHCGFNRDTGREYKTRVGKDPSKKRPASDSKMAGVIDDVASLGMRPVYPLIGALIGGAIGAAIWAGLAYSTGYEFRWTAIAVGALCGFGARMGGEAQTTGGGMIAGLLAACMAILSIGAGKYVALNMIFERDFGGNPFDVGTANVYDLSENDVLANMTFELCRQKIDAGEEIAWNDLTLPIQIAEWPDDYPESFQDEVYDRWTDMSDAEQLRFRRDISDIYGLNSYRDVDVDWAMQVLADEMVIELSDIGESIDWPDPHLYNQAAIWPADYPDEIITQVRQEWDQLSEDERSERRYSAVDAHNELAEELSSMSGEFTLNVVIESFKHPFQIMFAIFAVGTAFWIGQNDS